MGRRCNKRIQRCGQILQQWGGGLAREVSRNIAYCKDKMLHLRSKRDPVLSLVEFDETRRSI